MIVTMLKEHYVLVAAEDKKDLRWLDNNGYDAVGEEFYQIIFKDFNDFLEEVKYLVDYGAFFEIRDDEDAPNRVLDDLIEEGFI